MPTHKGKWVLHNKSWFSDLTTKQCHITYSMDQIFKPDAQKDQFIRKIDMTDLD